MSELAGKLGAIYKQTDDAAVAFTKEATDEDATGLRYQISDEDMRYFDPDTAVLVYADDVLVESGYTVEYPGGVIVFAVDPEATITVSGAYLTMEAVGSLYNWSLDPTINTLETTALGDSAKSFIAGLLEFTGSAEGYWLDNSFLAALGSRLALALYVDTTSGSEKWYDCFGIITGDNIKVDEADVVKETIPFQGTGGLYFRQNIPA